MSYSSKEYSQARKILGKNVVAQYIFPEYFLHLNTKDPAFSDLVKNNEIEDIPNSIIKSRVDNYLMKTKTLELKSKPIATWNDFPKFEFFQYVMSNKQLFTNLENATFDQLDALDIKVRNKAISVDQAINELNLDYNEVKRFLSTMIDEFKIGDD